MQVLASPRDRTDLHAVLFKNLVQTLYCRPASIFLANELGQIIPDELVDRGIAVKRYLPGRPQQIVVDRQS